MNDLNAVSSRRARRSFAVALAAVISAAGIAQQADAAFTITIEPSNQTLTPGDTGFLDVFATSDSSGSLFGFNVTLSIDPASGVSFTGANNTDVPNYIFDGNSFGFGFANPSGPYTADISDSAANFDQSITPDTFGLGRIFFSVGAGTAGVYDVEIDSATAFIDPLGNTVPFSPTGPSGATITVVPEPSTFALTGSALIAALLAWTKRRRGRLALTV